MAMITLDKFKKSIKINKKLISWTIWFEILEKIQLLIKLYIVLKSRLKIFKYR